MLHARAARALSLLAFAAWPACQCDEPLVVPFGSVTGVACDPETGAPIAGERVRLETDDDERLRTETDEDGRYTIEDVPPGRVVLTLPGDRDERVDVESGEATIVVDEACRELPHATVGDVHGRVCNRHIGDPIRAGTVKIIAADGRVFSTVTDDEGTFLLEDVPTGPQVLTVTAPGFNVAQEVTVVADETVEVDPGEACENPAPVGVGSVEGRVCAPDGALWLAGATAWIDPFGDASQRIEGTTDGDGRFSLEGVPAGEQTVHVEKGAFSAQWDVTVPEGGVATIPETECALDDTVNIAVVHGSNFDNVEGVLQEIGVPAESVTVYSTTWAEQLLGDDHGLDEVDILFLNCRSFEGTYAARPDMQARLRAFVAQGGALHASDQAYDLIEITWPDQIEFLGDDVVRGAADQGAITDIEADIIDASLVAAMGPTVHLHYGLETWSIMESVAPGVDVYVRATSPQLSGALVTDAPQIVGFHEGLGHVVYSSFHQEPGIGAGQEQIMQLLMFEL